LAKKMIITGLFVLDFLFITLKKRKIYILTIITIEYSILGMVGGELMQVNGVVKLEELLTEIEPAPSHEPLSHVSDPNYILELAKNTSRKGGLIKDGKRRSYNWEAN